MRIGYDPEVKYRHLEIDARARIAWGHDKRRVEAFLRANDVPSGRIHKIVDTATEERDAAFRKRGLWDLALAAFIGLVALRFALPIALEEGIRAGVSALGPFDYIILMITGWLAAQGTTRLAFGARGEDSPNHGSDFVNRTVARAIQIRATIVVMVLLGVLVASVLR